MPLIFLKNDIGIYKQKEKNSKLNRKREAAMDHKDIAEMGILPFK